ncbi:hypothetical protein QE152_g27378 [Popillia japonica]|uniref:Uncharacterized protein n=1 Tax=Popillia japonica TaxID=7064 RepID=A0AAW1JVH4_POPJA
MLNNDEAICVAIALAVCLKNKKKRRWMEGWLKKRNKYTHKNLLNDLRLSESNDFRNFLRLDGTSFDALLQVSTPRISNMNTMTRDAIPPSQRLSITLRYLATGNSLKT